MILASRDTLRYAGGAEWYWISRWPPTDTQIRKTTNLTRVHGVPSFPVPYRSGLKPPVQAKELVAETPPQQERGRKMKASFFMLHFCVACQGVPDKQPLISKTATTEAAFGTDNLLLEELRLVKHSHPQLMLTHVSQSYICLTDNRKGLNDRSKR